VGGDIINHETSLHKIFPLNEIDVNLVSSDDENVFDTGNWKL
jgi:hypothetical protein